MPGWLLWLHQHPAGWALRSDHIKLYQGRWRMGHCQVLPAAEGTHGEQSGLGDWACQLPVPGRLTPMARWPLWLFLIPLGKHTPGRGEEEGVSLLEDALPSHSPFASSPWRPGCRPGGCRRGVRPPRVAGCAQWSWFSGGSSWQSWPSLLSGRAMQMVSLNSEPLGQPDFGSSSSS